MNDSQQEMAYLDRAQIWGGLIDFCEELEREEIEAKVGQPDRDPGVMTSSFLDPGGAPALKRAKSKHPKPGYYDPQSMSRAVARDLGLI